MVSVGSPSTNGTIAGFNDGIFLIDSDDTLVVEHLTINNLTVDDMNHFVFGVHIDGSQNVIVRYMQFEFLRAPHKEAVDVFASDCGRESYRRYWAAAPGSVSASPAPATR